MIKKPNLRFNTVQKAALGFLGVILLGSVLLWLPISNQEPISYLDSLFTATTAVCVTGLITIVPAAQFTLFGKTILLLLIQIGGLGIIACVFLFYIISKKKISIRERVTILENYGLDSLSGMVRLIIKIVKGTFFVEGLGALAYSFQFIPEYGWLKGIGYSVFHSVSAFCNAGIDILGDSSFIQYAENPLVSITTMLLIALGGLGFLVWSDVIGNTRRVLKEKAPYARLFTRLTLHSKIVLLMTAVLIAGGAFGFLLLEYHNPDTLGNLSPGGKVLAAFFQSVTTRTAGYITIPQGALKESSMLLGCILMFIGGSPMGTAGGVKTTTIAMLFLSCVSIIRGGRDTECFRRKIAPENIRTGFCVVMVFFTTLLTGTFLVTIFEEGVGIMRILYETTSAIATVGLTADLTPSLSAAGKLVIIMLMYLGRIGPITMVLAFGGRMHSKDHHRELPVRRIMVG